MKRNIFIFHGTEGHPQENWFPWLKEELEKKGHKVTVPQFPSPPVIAAKVSEWFDVLDSYKELLDEDAVIVGHSLGGVFTLRVLEQIGHHICAAFLVGTPIGVRPILNYERDDSFSGFEFDWQTIRKNARDFVVYHSDDDPYVGLENGKELAKKLAVELSFIPNAGHFNKPAGYTKFEALRDRLLDVMD